MRPVLALPLRRGADSMRILRPFGSHPERYAAYGMQGHNGIDLEADPGELVLAVDDGEVVEMRFDASGYGVTVKLSHVWGESRYAHGLPRSLPAELELGRAVRQGDRIFVVDGGHAGAAPRLHFAVRLRRDDGSLDFGNAGGFHGYEDPLPFLHPALRLAEAAPVRARKGAAAA